MIDISGWTGMYDPPDPPRAPCFRKRGVEDLETTERGDAPAAAPKNVIQPPPDTQYGGKRSLL